MCSWIKPHIAPKECLFTRNFQMGTEKKNFELDINAVKRVCNPFSTVNNKRKMSSKCSLSRVTLHSSYTSCIIILSYSPFSFNKFLNYFYNKLYSHSLSKYLKIKRRGRRITDTYRSFPLFLKNIICKESQWHILMLVCQ